MGHDSTIQREEDQGRTYRKMADTLSAGSESAWGGYCRSWSDGGEPIGFQRRHVYLCRNLQG